MFRGLCYGVAAPMVTLLTLLPVSLNGMGVREAGMVICPRPRSALSPGVGDDAGIPVVSRADGRQPARRPAFTHSPAVVDRGLGSFGGAA